MIGALAAVAASVLGLLHVLPGAAPYVLGGLGLVTCATGAREVVRGRRMRAEREAKARHTSHSQ